MTTNHKLKKKQIRSAKLKKAKQKQIQKNSELTKLKKTLSKLKGFSKDIEELKNLFDMNTTEDVVVPESISSGSTSVDFEGETENPFK